MDKGYKVKIIGFVFMSFLGYICIGLPLAVLPMFIHKTLGFSEIIAGAVISLQYVTTFIIRGYAGTVVDKRGPKIAVSISMISFVVSGILFFLSIWLKNSAIISLSIISVSRLIMGCAEGMIGASPINWAMMVIGRKHTGEIMSYNGIANYGALAIGAPVGVWIQQSIGIEYIGVLIVCIGILGFLYALPKPPVRAEVSAEKISFFKVLGIVAPYGMSLGLAAIGFGGISNFITLYYDFFGWKNAAFSLSIFSVMFILGRFAFSKAIAKKGGLQVAFNCLIVEAIGLALLFSAQHPLMALLGAAVTGLGFSLVFPALGVEAVKLAPVANSGAALAAYGLFIDLSLGVTGPFAGTVINLFGMPYLFLFCGIMVVIGNCWFLRN